MREVVLDTETTGLDPAEGHRIVEIGCVELLNHVPTGRIFQQYVNPERAMPAGAFAIHGLSGEFLADKPRFADMATLFLSFIADSTLIIHNAAFDLAFLNAELQRLRYAAIPRERAIDTIELARRKYPGAPANLDALCRRFDIDVSERIQHGALKDAHLLAAVYLELLGGRQPGFDLGKARTRVSTGTAVQHLPRRIQPTAAEEGAHKALLQRLHNPIWTPLEESTLTPKTRDFG
jgi:DNA polymerase-3 subunit epsilon